MPRYVRNFWVDADIDGRSTTLAGGPAAKDGGLDVTFKIRNEGGVETALTVTGRVDYDGKLVLRVWDATNGLIHVVETVR